jgi:serine/threonine protein phosphatase 1
MNRTLAIGDIHGCLTAFETLMSIVQPDGGDTLVLLGDYVDRGPNTSGVLDRILDLAETTRLVPLRGNHDIMLLEARTESDLYVHQWLAVGGDATLASYGGSLANVPPSHWHLLRNTAPFYETDSHIFVHAGAEYATPMPEQHPGTLYWEKMRNPQPHFSGKTVVTGHTSQKNGLPLDFGHTLCLDTFAYGGGWLSCLDVVTGQIHQANELGETRLLWRDEL